MDCIACQASLSFTISQSLLKFMSVELMMLSNHLIICCPSSPFNFNLSPASGSFPESPSFTGSKNNVAIPLVKVTNNIIGDTVKILLAKLYHWIGRWVNYQLHYTNVLLVLTFIFYFSESKWQSLSYHRALGLKLNIQKMKIMASGPTTSWEIDGETVSDVIFGGLQDHCRWWLQPWS